MVTHPPSAVMALQPTINIGMIGSVSNGKSSLVERLTTTKTQRHSSEKKTNKTINLGYANAKIYKCSSCPAPQAYQPYPGSADKVECSICKEPLILVKHVSFVDCPGHNMLIATMLNGTCIMDSTILVESINGAQLPAPQTVEHLKAAQIMGLTNSIVCINKMDLVKRDVALIKIAEFRKYLNSCPVTKKSNIIPTVGNTGINKDVLCEYLCNIPEPKRNLDAQANMIIIRSFNINRSDNKDVKKILGGVVGGAVMQGVLKIGDKVEIVPGLVKKIGDQWMYTPLISTVKTINTEGTKLESAYPGGLIAVQLDLDPGITSKNGLVGNTLRVIQDKLEYTDPKIYHEIHIQLELLSSLELTKDDHLTVNYNACNVNCIVKKISNNKLILLQLHRPIAVQVNEYVTLSRGTDKLLSNLTVIGRGKVIDGTVSQKCTVEQFCRHE